MVRRKQAHLEGIFMAWFFATLRTAFTFTKGQRGCLPEHSYEHWHEG